MATDEVKRLEKMIEVVVRSIPREKESFEIYQTVAAESKTEMGRLLFGMLAEQEEEHESKLRAVLDIMQRELDVALGKQPKQDATPQIHDVGVTREDKLRDIERIIEIAVRMIPREIRARELYNSTAEWAGQSRTGRMFHELAEEEHSHEGKLRGILELYKKELIKVKSGQD